MRAELLDINRHRRGQTLWTKRVEARRTSIRIGAKRKSIFLSRFVACNQGFTVLDSCRRTGENCDFWSLRLGFGVTSHAITPSELLVSFRTGFDAKVIGVYSLCELTWLETNWEKFLIAGATLRYRGLDPNGGNSKNESFDQDQRR